MKVFNMTLARTVLFFTVLAGCAISARAQGGDQILDGIGETGMIARYIFNGDSKDWSRNNLHGRIHGPGAKFRKDEQFGKVLSLPGDNESFVSLPGEALTGIESLSITGWIYLHTDEKGVHFFDFGKDTGNRFAMTPSGTADREGCGVAVISGENQTRGPASPALQTGRWEHVAVVLDIPSKSIRTYINGKQAGERKEVPLDLAKVFDSESGKNNQLYIGKSLVQGIPYLSADLYDFRIYRIPLNEKQVGRIYNNALRGDHGSSAGTEKPEDDLPVFSENEPGLYNRYLLSVADVEVETEAGYLPRLPRYLKGTYSKGMEGPEVRVLWPAPTDNSEVLKPGRYTVTGRIPGTGLQPKATVTVKEAKETATPRRVLDVFPLDQVSLTQGAHGHETKFTENRDKFIITLAKTDPDAFLYMFRNAFGQEQPDSATPLGVWDSQETKLRGHATGHYLTAIAQAYAGTGYDKSLHDNFADKMEYMVNTLYELSQMAGKPAEAGGTHVSDPVAVPPGPGRPDYDSDLSEEGIRTDYQNWGEGYISAYPPDQFIMLEKGAKYGGQKNQVWAPYYTLHKILAGLMDVYEVSGNPKALDIVTGMSDWVHARLSQLPTETLIGMWNTYIAGEFGGMNEAMARLYRITGESRYLETARLFDNIKMFFGDARHSHGLARNVDSFRGLHANQHIPQVVGAIEMYRDSDAPEYYRVADNFWYKTVNDYMYSIGGVAGARNPVNAECFIAEPATLYENGFSAGGQNETCATYNMLKLTRNLFLFEPRAELMDYYERGLYNHILASVAEDSPANTYHVPLRPGSVKQFGNPDMTGFTCCNGTAIESSTKLQNAVYFKSKDNRALYVNLYVPSVLQWEERDVTLTQVTDFPKEDQTRLTVKGSGKFDINVRVPKWATHGFVVTINGKKQKHKAVPGTYLTLNRNWKDGDVITLQMPFGFHLEPVMDQQNIASLFYGPVLLAAQESGPRKDWRKVTLDAGDIGKSVKGDPAKLEFTIDDTVFKPFYETYGRHSVYLDVTLK
ncbi:DUF1680 family protein [Sinomicrobium oceani]|uniref:DUF1680 family protein n=1 Tax=Sinomicrobium oceani TaxID=1150368 RepID=A0A1K1R039_9FLAO|nr:beta-L-arabinofuranosidase domain-containing protein [Sinomicrobium oceani]SFW65535.1 DUF1680 family protein [Sinomicrobium oceani]